MHIFQVLFCWGLMVVSSWTLFSNEHDLWGCFVAKFRVLYVDGDGYLWADDIQMMDLSQVRVELLQYWKREGYSRWCGWACKVLLLCFFFFFCLFVLFFFAFALCFVFCFLLLFFVFVFCFFLFLVLSF